MNKHLRLTMIGRPIQLAGLCLVPLLHVALCRALSESAWIWPPLSIFYIPAFLIVVYSAVNPVWLGPPIGVCVLWAGELIFAMSQGRRGYGFPSCVERIGDGKLQYVLVMVAVAIAGWLMVALRRYLHLPDPSLCASCGYDLRGTISAGRCDCPECGDEIRRSG
ncbi:MAG: hypothetical protein WD768_06235 [Phycisphaeraceae bacterium]